MTGIGFEEGGAGRRGRLRVLSVVIPLVGLAVLYPLRLLLARVWPPLAVETVLGAVVIAGIIGFSWAVFRVGTTPFERKGGVLTKAGPCGKL